MDSGGQLDVPAPSQEGRESAQAVAGEIKP
jgi:hypothetical protein